MQARLTNSNRGRAMASYRTVDIVMSAAAQLMIGGLEPASYVSYNLLAILCCACMLPIVLTKMKQPETPSSPRLRPIKTFKVSPLGAAGVMVAGTSPAAFRMVGPLYGQEIGLAAGQIGSFLATVLIGGAVAQLPVGWLADKYDRRWVLIGLSVIGILACSLLAVSSSDNHRQIFLIAALFGASTYPTFSVSTAHANDFAKSDSMVEINASLMFIYGVGAIFSPLIASILIQNFGPSALFAYISLAHVFLVGFGLQRMTKRLTEEEKLLMRIFHERRL